ncbi:MAG: hypothetical protein GOVbin703_145 [Prokaryotic dsDNA virus sp.]|nr:MAG: hypothetical protein GOVbin703_145 [Prokaryotic dsDNA virus sp.]
MSPWIKSGLIEFIKIMALFGLIVFCYSLVLIICQDLGVDPIWGYITVFVAAMFSIALGTEKFKYELQRISNKKEKE